MGDRPCPSARAPRLSLPDFLFFLPPAMVRPGGRVLSDACPRLRKIPHKLRATGRPQGDKVPCSVLAQVAGRADDFDLLEGRVFNLLHKWRWLDGIGTRNRDMIIMSFVALILAVTLLGWRLRLRRRR